MATRIIVNGAQGKMGKLACEALEKHPAFVLVAQLGRQDNLRQAIVEQRAEIVVDLTRADCVYDNSLSIIESGAHPVIGTSGLVEEQIQVLQRRCQEFGLGGLIVPNFSISAVLMMRFAAQAACFLPEVEIIELHHQQKLDAPSGTAMKTAELIAKARKSPKNSLTSHELVKGARGGEYQDVSIHSLRLPGIMAQQQVIFGTPGETLTLIHNNIDRAAYMPGIILACQKVKELNRLYYGLEHLLEANSCQIPI